jgi:hypothetical protein
MTRIRRGSFPKIPTSGEPGTPPSLHRYLYAYSNPTVYVDLFGYASEKSFLEQGADFVRGLSDDSKAYVSDLNKKQDIGLGDRVLAATMGIGNGSLDLVAGTLDLADTGVDLVKASTPIISQTKAGKDADRRIRGKANRAAKAVKKVVKAVVEDRSRQRLGITWKRPSLKGT